MLLWWSGRWGEDEYRVIGSRVRLWVGGVDVGGTMEGSRAGAEIVEDMRVVGGFGSCGTRHGGRRSKRGGADVGWRRIAGETDPGSGG